MMKRFCTACLSALLLLSVTACSGANLTPEETEARLVRSAAALPSTEIEDIQLTQTFAGEPAQYTADISLIWNEEQGRFNTEKALEAYSRSFVERISSRAPGVSALMLSWTVPFHSSEEPAMEFTYKKSNGKLEQSASQSRFIDGSFGADAFIDPDASVEVPVNRLGSEEDEEPIEYRTPANAYYILTNLHKPYHKTELLPKAHSPMHKTAPGIPGGSPSWTSAEDAAAGTTGSAPSAADAGTDAAAAAEAQPEAETPAAAAGNASQNASSGTQSASTAGTANTGSTATGQQTASTTQSDASGRTIYVSRTGSHYHYDNRCDGGTYYEAAPGEVQGRGLTPCEKCVL